MIPRPIAVKALDNYLLEIIFDNQEMKIFDMSEKIKKKYYRDLQNKTIFKSVKVSDITLEWITGQDICPDGLYLNSK